MNNPEAFKEDEVRSIKFIVPGLPFGKQRPKVTVRKFTGSDGKEKKFAKAYTPKKTVNYENLVKMAYQEKAKGKRKVEDSVMGVAIEAEMQGFIYGFKVFEILLNRELATA